MSSYVWIIIGVILSVAGVAAGIAVPVCRTVRHNKRVDLARHVLDKKGISGRDAAQVLQAVIGQLEAGPPESESPPQLRALQAVAGQVADKVRPRSRRARQSQPEQPPPTGSDPTTGQAA